MATEPEFDREKYVNPEWAFSEEVFARYDIRNEGQAEEGTDVSSLSCDVYPLVDSLSDQEATNFVSVPFVQLLEGTSAPIVVNFGSYS